MKEFNLNHFSTVSKNDWTQLAGKQLKNEEAVTALSWLSDGQLKMDPYYEQSDLEKLNYLQTFFGATNPINWKLYESVEVSEVDIGNREALDALGGGCDGIIFRINDEVNFDSLLNEIDRDICDLSIWTKLALEKIPKNLTGFVISKNASNAVICYGKSEVEKNVMAIQNLSDQRHIVRTASSDFFLEIASIRALRFLLHDVSQIDPWAIEIHTSVPRHRDEDQQWFLNSTAGLASILGGTTSINFATGIGNPRISRNVGNLIREESGISQYTDQCGGSYYIETLTDKIIRECKNQLSK